jgi:hypothetical protein
MGSRTICYSFLDLANVRDASDKFSKIKKSSGHLTTSEVQGTNSQQTPFEKEIPPSLCSFDLLLLYNPETFHMAGEGVQCMQRPDDYQALSRKTRITTPLVLDWVNPSKKTKHSSRVSADSTTKPENHKFRCTMSSNSTSCLVSVIR